MTLEQSDKEAAAVQKTPHRVTLEQMEKRVIRKGFIRGGDVVLPGPTLADSDVSDFKAAQALTVCVLLLDNGWTLVGKSAPADPKNFDKDLGEKLAYEDCIRQLWPLEGYLLRDSLNSAETAG